MKLVLALCLTSASAFVAPAAQRAGVSLGAEEEAAPAPAPAPVAAAAAVDLEAMAAELNPVVKFWDPLGLAEKDFWSQGNAATVGFLRQAEIKHGRVAMFGFVGYLVHAQGVTWPFKMSLDGSSWPALGGDSVISLWDKLPTASKWQIILFVGLLEFNDEWQYRGPAADAPATAKPKHYMSGGKPGDYPDFSGIPWSPLPLYDPLGLNKKKSPEALAKSRLAEINNGRLAMIGLFGFLAESVVPGSVPALAKVGLPHYDGNVMIPFEGDFSIFS